MRLTRLGGFSVHNNDSMDRAEKVEVLMLTTAAISAGHACILDADTTGYKVKKAPVGAAAQQSLFVGIYEGFGGSGAVAGTGYTGRDAATGDIVFITAYGKAIATVEGTASGAVGWRCGVETNAAAGSLKSVANAVAGELYCAPAVMLEAYTSTTAAAKSVFIRAL